MKEYISRVIKIEIFESDLKSYSMKTLGFIILLMTVQRNVCGKGINEDHDVLDHSNEEDCENVNEWVVHIPKGKTIK